MKLTNIERSLLKKLMQSPEFPLVQRMGEMMCREIEEESIMRSTEWETMSAGLLKEGRLLGIKCFMREFYNQFEK